MNLPACIIHSATTDFSISTVFTDEEVAIIKYRNDPQLPFTAYSNLLAAHASFKEILMN